MADIKPPSKVISGTKPWERDVLVTTTTVLSTTGGTVWGAAHRAIDYLEAVQQQIGLTRPGVRVSDAGVGG